jgi:1-pyrroline-5-carboxylate dehydrogenase
LFAHENWLAPSVGFEANLAALASRRTLKDLTLGPVLSVTTETFEAHRDALLQVWR